MLLAVASVKLKNLPETRSDLLAALQRTPAAVRIIRPSTSQITGLAISPDGRLLATGDAAGTVRFEDLQTWKPSGSAIPLPAPVPPLGVRFSPNGRTVAVVAAGEICPGCFSSTWHHGTAACWQLVRGRGASPYRLDHHRLLARWPADRRRAGRQPGQRGMDQSGVARPGRRLVREAVWQRPYPLHAGQEELQVGFTPDGNLVTSAEQGTTDIWDTRTGRITRQFPIGGRFALSPNGQLAAIGLNSASAVHSAATLELLDLRTGARRILQPIPTSTWLSTLAFTPDGKLVAGGALDGDVRVWDVGSGSIVQTFVSQSGSRLQLGVDPHGRTILSGAGDGSVVAWDISGTQALGRTFGWSPPDNGCPFAPCYVVNPAGTIMATDEADGTVALVDLRSLRWYASLPATRAFIVSGLAFTPDGQLLVTGDAGGNITFWDVRSRAVLRRLHVADPVTWLAISPDQRLLAIQTQKVDASDTRVETFDFATGTPLLHFAVPYGSGGVAFSADNRELAALGCCAPGSSIEVWDTTSGRELFHPRLAVQVHTIAFSPTSPVLAAGTADGKILMWDTRRAAQIRAPITTAASNVLTIAFSPDGRALAASFFNGDTILWDLQSGQRMGDSFPAMAGAIPTPLFSPNGDLLINYNGTAADWPTDLASWERYACQVAGRDLTPNEWAAVLPNRPYQQVCPP